VPTPTCAMSEARERRVEEDAAPRKCDLAEPKELKN
jgi:hypothetical protein